MPLTSILRTTITTKDTYPMSTARDFDFLHGEWRVHHRRLVTRFADNQQWQEFASDVTVWPTLDGQGNVDDNRIEIPSGTYSAMSIRAFDEVSGQWAIWWLDARNPHSMEVPVLGSFESGSGLFLADDVIDGRDVKVRFLWTDTQTSKPRWEQVV